MCDRAIMDGSRFVAFFAGPTGAAANLFRWAMADAGRLSEGEGAKGHANRALLHVGGL